jgi:uncharacterized sulfatase
MFQTPTTRVWRRLYDEGRLRPPQTFFWEVKPVEELYDLESDPHNVVNLARAPAHAARIRTLSAALDAHLLDVRDLGLLPECAIRSRAGNGAPYTVARTPGVVYAAVQAAASLALQPATTARHRAALRSSDPDVRYWAAQHWLIHAIAGGEGELLPLLSDTEPAPRVTAAEYLARHGSADARTRAIAALLETADLRRDGFYAALLALNALAHVPELQAETLAALKRLPASDPSIHAREVDYLPRLIEAIVERRR